MYCTTPAGSYRRDSLGVWSGPLAAMRSPDDDVEPAACELRATGSRLTMGVASFSVCPAI